MSQEFTVVHPAILLRISSLHTFRTLQMGGVQIPKATERRSSRESLTQERGKKRISQFNTVQSNTA